MEHLLCNICVFPVACSSQIGLIFTVIKIPPLIQRHPFFFFFLPVVCYLCSHAELYLSSKHFICSMTLSYIGFICIGFICSVERWFARPFTSPWKSCIQYKWKKFAEVSVKLFYEIFCCVLSLLLYCSGLESQSTDVWPDIRYRITKADRNISRW